MKTYLFIYDIEDDDYELIMKVKPLYCSEGSSDSLNITNTEYIPTKGDKLYFLPGVNIPRIKLKDLSLQYGIKTVRDINQATHIFAGNNTKDKIMDCNWYYSIDTSIIRAIINDPELNMDDYYKENLRQALEFYEEEKIIMEYSTASSLRNSTSAVIKKYSCSNLLSTSSIYYSVDKEHENLFPHILNLEIYNESKLLKYINGNDAATIDETMFNQISDMFDSSDTDNHILAMEIMANCNYIDSLLYIEMLFNKHSYEMSQCHTKNHVNFKSLISFLGKNKNYLNTDIDQIVNSLIVKDVLDIEKVNVIMKHYGNDIANRGGTKHFEIKSVTLNENLAKKLNTNYTYEVYSDFIPEISIDTPEIHENVTDFNSLEDIIIDTVVDTNDVEIVNEDIENESTIIESNESKLDLITEELEIDNQQEVLEKELNNNQIEEKDDNGFEWF